VASILAAVLGVAAALTLVGQTVAEGPTPPCQGNEDATTIQQKTYTGSSGADIIQGSDQDHVIYGRGGPDTICGYLGQDQILGGRGGDELWGDQQNDDLFGGRQADTLRGANGSNDLCKGGNPPPPNPGAEDPDGAVECEEIKGASPL
jgi:Ca2+-binding RTX toxin-like protein